MVIGYIESGKSREHDAKGFFLAEGSLTWWAIGASLIASNISAEQFIGMSGNGILLGSLYRFMNGSPQYR
jgi:SSS family solute:Na+ symporter